MDRPAETPADLAAAIAAWRRRGAQRVDPLGFGVIEALARRAAAHEGEARRLLDRRLVALLDAFGPRFEAAQAAARARRPSPAATSPLAELAAGLSIAPTADLKTVQAFRGSWTRLRTSQRLSQSLARAPDQAGPLNSHALLLRALQQLQALSPAYLDRFVAYAEALLEVDAAGLSATAAAPGRR